MVRQVSRGHGHQYAAHNLGEVIDGITMVIDKPDVDTRELNSIIKGPDFPTQDLSMAARDN